MEIFVFLKNRERLVDKYRLSTMVRIESVVDYWSPDIKNSVYALTGMAKSEVRNVTQESQEQCR